MSPPSTFTGIQRLLKFEIPQPRACGAQPPALIGEDSAPSCGLPERGVDRDLRSAIRQVVSSFGRTPGALPGSNFGSSNSNDGRDEVPCQESDRTACGRRRFLGWSLAVSCGLLIPGGRAAAAATGPARQLEFYNLHTGEALRAVYWEGGRYLPDALAEIDHVLRDFRTGEVRSIDPALLDLLHRLRLAMECDRPVHVISGYRCPATNAMLARRSNGVAKNSYHVKGMAIDLRLPDRDLKDLRNAALTLAGGGVGYYPKSDFVHMDTGPVRNW